MTVEMQEGPPQPIINELSVGLAVAQLDMAKSNLFQASSRYSVVPTERNSSKLQEASRELSDAFRQSIETIVDDKTIETDQKGPMIATLFKGEDASRVEHLSLLASEKTIFRESPIAAEDITSVITALLHQGRQGDALDTALFYYHNCLAVDMERFVEDIAKSRNARLIRASKIVGKHALEVGKVGAAIAIGLRLGRARKR